MPTVSAADFTDALRQARLLDAVQLHECARDVLPRFPEPRALAGELIRRDWLTPYQANQLLQGRGPDLLLGSYVLLERLGEGGMGTVFKARNWKLGRIVALKLIRKERLDNADAVRRFHREIRAAAQLDHPNIVRAIDADEVAGTHLLVMEHVPGMDLGRLVKQQGPSPIDKACDYARQAALGLQHACDRGLVHRDIKPSNLLLTPQGVVKILDMGLARLGRAGEDTEASSAITHEGVVMGTPDYIAPEQTLDSHAVDIRADLYSLGCTLYFLLTGKVPFPGGSLGEKIARHQMREPEPVEQRRPGTPAAVAAVVRKLMAKRPEHRYRTPTEAAAALAAAAQVQASPAAPAATPAAEATGTGWSSLDALSGADKTVASPLRRRAPWRPSPWFLIGTTVGVAVPALGLMVFFLMLPRPPGPPTDPARPPVKSTEREPRQETAEAAFEKWAREVAVLPAEAQGDAVGAELKRRNRDFDGVVQATVENGVVTRLAFRTDDVTDVTPVQALPALMVLSCSGSRSGKGRISDLSPLKKMKLLTDLECSCTEVSDLSPLKEAKMTRFNCSLTRVSDLSPLKNMKLTYLDCGDTAVSDLSPLEGMPLGFLACPHTRTSDLSPLKNLPLTFLRFDDTKVTNLSPLQKVPLRNLEYDFVAKRDAELLRSIPTLETINGQPAAVVLKAAGVPPP